MFLSAFCHRFEFDVSLQEAQTRKLDVAVKNNKMFHMRERKDIGMVGDATCGRLCLFIPDARFQRLTAVEMLYAVRQQQIYSLYMSTLWILIVQCCECFYFIHTLHTNVWTAVVVTILQFATQSG